MVQEFEAGGRLGSAAPGLVDQGNFSGVTKARGLGRNSRFRCLTLDMDNTVWQHAVYNTVYEARYAMHSIEPLKVETANSEQLENLRLELRRGYLVVAVLAQLRHEHYGYTLRKALADHGLTIDEGTLYPLLRRLEAQGLLLSEWREEAKRKKRFYRLSPEGEEILAKLLDEWRDLNGSLDRILEGGAKK